LNDGARLSDGEAMERAIALAWRGWGRVGSNPLVGAVVLRDGRIVGEGFHAEFGGAHGEVAALASAGEAARGSDLVVTLEPCAHHGKTPPCTEAIVAAGIRRVVFGAPDVDPAARGGAEALRRCGIAVTSGVMAEAVQAQNALFFHRHSNPGRPFVAVKLATSLDAAIADLEGRSQWVTGEEARAYVHWLRAGFEAIGVGAGTARRDNPALTVRGEPAPSRPPLRVVFDRRSELPMSGTLVSTAREVPTLVLAGSETPAGRIKELEAAGVEVMVADEPRRALGALRKRGVANVLIEGGGVLAGRLLAAGLVDRLYLVLAPLFLGERALRAFHGVPDVAITDVARWRAVERRPLGDDTLLVYDRP
jgi:diaminohydroxyphosphoribosylaminopyrimidine deaminase/5-amino-6-(5-phosphoribosylamino)uracil reductase